jgi:hypothetical protein
MRWDCPRWWREKVDWLRLEIFRLARSFFFENDRSGGVRRQPHRLALDLRNQAQIDVVMMALVSSLAAVLSSEPDAVTRDSIDRTDGNSIGADHLHVFFDVAAPHFTPPI